MSKYSAQTFQSFLREQLKGLSSTVVNDIRTIISDQAPTTEAHLDVIAHSDKLDQHLPITASLCHNIDKVNNWKLANSVANVLTKEQLAVIAQYDQAGVEITEVTYQVLIEWFADCWRQANNGSKQLAAQISIQDDIEAFDLNRGEWIQKETNHET